MTDPNLPAFYDQAVAQGAPIISTRGPLSPVVVAQWGVRNGLSANSAFRIAQELSVGIRRQTFLQVYSQLKVNYATRLASIGALMTAIPQGADIAKVPTKVQSGYIQYVDLFVRPSGGGPVTVVNQAFRTNQLLSRDAAVDLIVGRYRGAVDRSKVSPAKWGTDPEHVVVGGVYTGTHEFIPTDFDQG